MKIKEVGMLTKLKHCLFACQTGDVNENAFQYDAYRPKQ